MNLDRSKQYILQTNCSFLQKYSQSLADKVLNQDNVEVRAAVTIQKHYRAYVARKVFTRLLADQLNQEEEEFFRRELERASDSTLWLRRSKLRRNLSEQKTVEDNCQRRRQQSAICIQRHWRLWRARSSFTAVDFDHSFISLLEENFPLIIEQYALSTSGMVFSSLTSSHPPQKIVRNIVPNNNNMSLFNELTDSEYTLELTSESNSECSRTERGSSVRIDQSEFNTPIPGKRPLIETSYVFEKELREDFDNPYFMDSDESDEEEEQTPVKMCSSQSLESRVSEGSTGSTHVCDSGFEDDTRGSSSSLPRSTQQAWSREDDYQVKKEIYNKPTAVQMCFVEEESDDSEVADDLRNISLLDIPEMFSQKRWSNVSQSHSEGNIASFKDQERESSRRPNSYCGEHLDMEQLKQGWRTSAHLMTSRQLANWLSVMQANFAKTNMELVEHLAERDTLQEQQDVLLQKIFALKSINEGTTVKTEPVPEKPSSFALKRRISSFFAK